MDGCWEDGGLGVGEGVRGVGECGGEWDVRIFGVFLFFLFRWQNDHF